MKGFLRLVFTSFQTVHTHTHQGVLAADLAAGRAELCWGRGIWPCWACWAGLGKAVASVFCFN